MGVLVGSGVFNRAPGLAEEIGADTWARTPNELIHNLETKNERRAADDQRTVGRNRKVGAPAGGASTAATVERRAAAA